MKSDRWTAENLEKMRYVGDEEGDALAAAILSPITPDDVEEQLNRLLGDLGADGSDDRHHGSGEGNLADIRSIRRTLAQKSEFHAGTFRVLDCMKVAGSALRAAEVASQYADSGSAGRFRDQAITAIRNAKKDLEVARKQVEQGSRTTWFTPQLKRAAYNDLLGVAEYLATAPDLLSTPESAAAERFSGYPSGFKDYFGPTPAPGWVNEELLAHASRVWEENVLFILLTLFSGSLPYCYLDRRGIPLLYETGKLTDERYISQRLFETGLMLSAVMSQGGIRVEHDLARQRAQVAEAAKSPDVTEIHLEHTAERSQNWSVVRDASPTPAAEGLSPSDGKSGRYLSGKGVLYAKKVRLLHAAMRHMVREPVQQPESVDPEAAQERGPLGRLAEAGWNEADGVPINQEDLAFTLLTFSYVIPTGLATWGRRPGKKETKAFLHCWKVTGHLMGIKEELLTDDPDEAEYLFNMLVERLQKGPRQPAAGEEKVADEDQQTSVKMTWAIIEFLNRYLPKPLHGLPAIMIEDQVGRDNARVLLASKRRWRPVTRAFFWTVASTSKIHSLMNRHIYSRFPPLQTFFEGLMQQVGMAFIESWRGPFERGPFMLPAELKDWELKAGVTDEFRQRLHQWRRRLFDLLALGLMLLIVGSLAIVVGVVLSLVNPGLSWFEGGLLIGVPLFVLASLSMQLMVARIARRRPALVGPITLVRRGQDASSRRR